MMKYINQNELYDEMKNVLHWSDPMLYSKYYRKNIMSNAGIPKENMYGRQTNASSEAGQNS